MLTAARTRFAANPSERDAEFRRYITTGRLETRALGYGAVDDGGLLAPQDFADRVWMRVKESFIRDYATVVKCSRAFQAPYLNAESAVGVRTPVGTAGATAGQITGYITDTDPTVALPSFATGGTPAFATRSITPRFMTVAVKVSQELLEDSESGASVETFLADMFGRKIAEEEHRQAIVGTGNGEYQGIRTALLDESRSVAAATATAVTLTDLQEVIDNYGLDTYDRACWLMHPYVYRALQSLASGSGTASVFETHSLDGEFRMTLYGRPVHFTKHLSLTGGTANNAKQPASGNRSVILADLSRYLIAEASTFQIERYDEQSAATGQVVFLGRIRSDGAYMDSRNGIVLTHP